MMPQRKPPRYVEIAEALAADIDSGRLAPGAPFPPVRRIAQEYRVAAGTAHEAVKLLSTQGRIEGGRDGMRVSHRPTASSPGERMARVMRGGPLLRPGETQVVHNVYLDEEPPPGAVTHLELGPGEAAGCREYTVRDWAGRTVTYGVSWIPRAVWDAVPGLREPVVLPGGNIGAVAAVLGVRTVAVPAVYEARAASEGEAERLGVASGSTVLAVATVCVGEDGSVVEYNESVHPEGYRVEGGR